jgi:hypothetical protein
MTWASRSNRQNYIAQQLAKRRMARAVETKRPDDPKVPITKRTGVVVAAQEGPPRTVDVRMADGIIPGVRTIGGGGLPTVGETVQVFWQDTEPFVFSGKAVEGSEDPVTPTGKDVIIANHLIVPADVWQVSFRRTGIASYTIGTTTTNGPFQSPGWTYLHHLEIFCRGAVISTVTQLILDVRTVGRSTPLPTTRRLKTVARTPAAGDESLFVEGTGPVLSLSQTVPENPRSSSFKMTIWKKTLDLPYHVTNHYVKEDSVGGVATPRDYFVNEMGYFRDTQVRDLDTITIKAQSGTGTPVFASGTEFIVFGYYGPNPNNP